MNEGFKVPNLEHLKEGVKPIMVAVGKYEDFGMLSYQKAFPEGTENNSRHEVDFEGSPEKLKENNFLNGGYETYVLSPIDGLDKYSRKFFDCSALIVAGVDKTTGKNISFLSHQDPKRFLIDKKEDFLRDLRLRLSEVKEVCKPGTIDVVLVGGNYFDEYLHRKKPLGKQNYLDSISLLSEEVEKVLGLRPRIINGPKEVGGHDSVYYENENRLLHLMRVEVNPKINSFTQDDVNDKTDPGMSNDFARLKLKK